MKYTEKGEVSLEVKRVETDDEGSRARLRITVADTGIGILAEEMDKLFVPFDRLDVSRTRNIEGAGLGLSITRQLLHMMDSELQVESLYGQGSRFYFSIWQGICDPEKIGDYKPLGNTVRRNTGDDERFFTAPGRHILVVDDMPMNLQVMKGLLKRSRMIIDTASSGDECIRKCGENDYDLVFLDYRMPLMDGIETLHALQAKYPEKMAHTPVIALTASATMGDQERLLKEGFTAYLSKPVVISDMEETMSRFLGDIPEESMPAASDISEEVQPVSQDITPDDTDEIPQAVRDMEELDPGKGLEFCGDVEDYVFALQTYAESVEEKAAALEAALKDDRTDDYVLIVHSLKSMSKSIGALHLYEMARDLEAAGREGRTDTIKTGTEAFVSEYRALGEKLSKELL